MIRSTRTSSFTCISITASSFSPQSSNKSASASACARVRGKPSKMKPPFLSPSSCSRIRPITISSVTSSPRSMTSATFLPISVPEVFAARSMSPVESWIMSRFSTRRPAWVPLPAPGGPSRIIFIDEQVLCVCACSDLCRTAAIFQSALRTDGPADGSELAEWYPWLRKPQSEPRCRQSRRGSQTDHAESPEGDKLPQDMQSPEPIRGSQHIPDTRRCAYQGGCPAQSHSGSSGCRPHRQV
mmetsp:Transcript_22859/g.38201  ORF Transcript_22859/g.38201 Transcript_22859/m.38201 type:complete len:241 (+) Transcript_22859:241-963(+)